MKNNILNVVFKHLIFKFSLKQEHIKMEMVLEDILCKIFVCDTVIVRYSGCVTELLQLVITLTSMEVTRLSFQESGRSDRISPYERQGRACL